MSAGDFTPEEVVHRGRANLVVRGRVSADGARCLVKMPLVEVPDAGQLAAYRHEHALLTRLAGEGVAVALGLWEVRGRPQLVLADTGARALSAWLTERRLKLAETLALLVGAGRALARLHAAGVVHCRLAPEHLVFGPGIVELIGFAGAAPPASRAAAPLDVHAYLAPEQTGAVDLPVDPRTDLYALGAIAWRLLCGRPPFEAADPAALVHAIMARRLEPPHRVAREIPPVLSAILAKLLAKDPRDRYQTADGLVADLERSQDGLAAGPGLAVSLDGANSWARFTDAARVYGRAHELAALREALAEASAGGAGAVLISGAAGSGKSRLLAELERPVAAAQGRAGLGRCERHLRDVPYHALRAALRAPLSRILGEDEQALARWRARLSDAVGGGRGPRLVGSIVPELTHLLSIAPDAPEAEPRIARGQIEAALVALIGALSAPGRPLVIAFDDLQWVDAASLDAIAAVLRAPALAGFLLIGTWREEPDGVPFARLAEALDAPGRAARRFELAPLDAAAVTELVADAWRCPAAAAEPLARALVARTAGNPFSLFAGLQALGGRGAIRAEAGGLHFDARAVAELPASDQAARLLIAELAGLPAETRRALGAAACCGPRFALAPLAAAVASSETEVLRALAPAVERGLLAQDARGAGPSTSFTHAKVHEAAYALLAPPERIAVHRALGEHLLASGVPEARFEAAVQLAHALAEMDVPARHRFAELALDCARRARAVGAFETALAHLARGLDATGADGWAAAYPLQLELSSVAAEVALLTGKDERLEAHVSDVLAHARCLADEVPAWVVRVRGLLERNRLAEAIEQSDVFLTRAGRPQPRGGGRLALAAEIARTLWMIGRRGSQELLALPEARDPVARGRQEVAIHAAIAQMVLQPTLLPFCILRDVQAVLTDGVTARGAQCWTGLALLYLNGPGWVEAATRYGDLALAQVERLGNMEAWPRTALITHTLIRPWTTPTVELEPEIRGMVARALEVGDSTTAHIALHQADHLSFVSGRELGAVARELERSHAVLAPHPDSPVLPYHRVLAAAVAALRTDGKFVRPPHENPLGPGLTAEALACELVMRLVLGELPEAVELARQLDLSITVVKALGCASHCLYACIALERAVERGVVPRRAVAGVARAARRYIERWCRHVPGRRYLLDWIAGARLASAGSAAAALIELEAALHGAWRHGVRQDAALIAEHAAAIAQAAGRPWLARTFRAEACGAYRQWGAAAKVARLEAEHPELAERGADGAAQVDLGAVLKASRAVSQQVVVDEVLLAIMASAMEIAGATSGVLVLVGPEGAHLAARAGAERHTALVREPLEGSSALPVGLVRYVLRTGEVVELSDARRGDPHPHSSALRERRVRAALCAPILRGGSVRGALYLENERAAGSLGHQRIEILRHLAAQAAISIENATLVGDLEAQVQARTQELTAARERADVASQAKSEFLARMSHELRTPLNTVLGYTQVLLATRELEPGTRGALETVLRSARHLLGLIDDVLDLAKIEARQLDLNAEDTPLRELLGGLPETFALDLKRKGLALVLDVAATVPARVRVDRGRLRQVLVNLLGNAVKFTDAGEVRLTVAARAEGADAALAFAVRDTGPGIPAEQHHAVFLPFVQVGPPGQRARGTGLGLPICRDLVERMGGRLTLESAPGRGSTFAFEIRVPVVEAPPEHVAAPAAAPAAPAPRVAPEGLAAVDVERLMEAALLGNMGLLRTRARELAGRSAAYGPLASELELLAAEFDDSRIVELLRTLTVT